MRTISQCWSDISLPIFTTSESDNSIIISSKLRSVKFLVFSNHAILICAKKRDVIRIDIVCRNHQFITEGIAFYKVRLGVPPGPRIPYPRLSWLCYLPSITSRLLNMAALAFRHFLHRVLAVDSGRSNSTKIGWQLHNACAKVGVNVSVPK